MADEQSMGAGLSFRLDAEQKALFASIEPVDTATPIDEAWLRARLAELGYGDLSYPGSTITVLLGQYNSGQHVEDYRLADCVDAKFKVALSQDRMKVTLDIVAAKGGAPVTTEAVMARLAELGVTECILPQAIDDAVQAGACEQAVIAQGRPAVTGDDGRLESQLPDVRDRRPRISETGHVDYRDLGDVLVVHPGDPLMRRIPARPGADGVTTKGERLPAKAGKEMMFAPNLSGVAISPENPDLLVATISGQPVQVKGGMIVEPVYVVETVSMSTGNIHFDGSVQIRGDVCAGMTVKATGDIEIGGVAEPANLDAGGGIVIKGGAMGSLGRKDGGDYVIRCAGTLSAGYLQQVKVVAGDSILIDDVVMQCDLSAARHIKVGKQRRGHIVGGRLQATYSITGKVLGSPNRIATFCEIGLDPALHERMVDLGKQRGAKEMQLVEISKLLAFAKQHPGKAPAETLQRAHNTMQVLYADIEVLRADEEEVTRKLELAQQSRVTAEQAMYDGLVVQLGTFRYSVAGEHGSGSIGLTEFGLGLLSSEAVDDPETSESARNE